MASGAGRRPAGGGGQDLLPPPRLRHFSSVLLVTLLSILVIGRIPLTRADDRNHRYAPGEEVTVWLNRIGPYHRPQETYDYYQLPFCRVGDPGLTNWAVDAVHHLEMSLFLFDVHFWVSA